MTPREIIQEADAIAQAAILLDEASAPAAFEPLRGRFVRLIAGAKAAALMVLSDLAGAGATLLDPERLGDMVLRPALMKQLESVITMLGVAAEEIHETGEVKSSFKSELAAIRLFFSDAEMTSAKPTEKPVSSEEEEFRREMLARVDTVESIIISLNRGAANQDKLTQIFREYHTLKGEAGVLGFADLNKWFHAVEDALEPARRRPVACTEDVIDAIIQATDLSRELLKGESVEKNLRDAAADLLKNLVKSAPDAAPSNAPAPAPAAGEPSAAEVDALFSSMAADAQGGGASGLPATPSVAAVAPAPKAPSPAPAAPTAGVQAAKAAPRPAPMPGGGNEHKASSEPVAKSADAPESSVSPEVQAAVSIEELNSIPIDVERLDRLIDQIGDVATLATLVAANPHIAALQESSVAADVQQLLRAASGLQGQVMMLRMVPVRPLFQRMRRVAYDVSKTSHKRVEIVFHGEATHVDRGVVGHLATALVHAIRNAIDHGIESAAERAARGKPEHGTITLTAERSGNEIAIEVADDGGGIKTELVRQHAIKMGLIEQTAVLSDKEINALIFRPGFSTADRVTTVSGRGVGMDAVNSALRALRGKAEVTSQPGRGTSVRLVFPVSLAAVEGLVVRVGASRLIIPVHCVRESFCPTAEVLQQVEGKGWIVRLRGLVLPVIHLGRAMGIPFDQVAAEDSLCVVIEQGGRTAALQVDEVVATRQVIIRELDGQLSDVPGISGGVILENRQVGLVVDVSRLLADVSTAVSEGRGVGGSGDRIETIEIGYNRVGMVDFTIKHRTRGTEAVNRFVINAFKAREFVTVQELTPLPKAPVGFAGMLLLRNRTIPVVDLATVLGMEPVHSPADTIVICEFSAKTIGLRVSSVNRVHYISWNDILPPPEGAEMVQIKQIVGSILMGQDIVFLLDFERIVDEVIQLYGGFGELLQGVEQRKSGSTILLVEDSGIIRKQTAAALEEAGLKVIQTANGQEAFDWLHAAASEVHGRGVSIFEKLDLILSDIEMPLMDGYTLTRAIKSHPALRALPVLLHSSLTNETIISRAKEVHADGFVSKCAPAELAEQLRRYL